MKNAAVASRPRLRGVHRRGARGGVESSAFALTVTVPLLCGGGSSASVGIVVRTMGAEVLVSEGERGRITRDTRSADTRAHDDPNGARACVSSATSA